MAGACFPLGLAHRSRACLHSFIGIEVMTRANRQVRFVADFNNPTNRDGFPRESCRRLSQRPEFCEYADSPGRAGLGHPEQLFLPGRGNGHRSPWINEVLASNRARARPD